MQGRDGFPGMRFDRVGNGEDRQHSAFVGQECHRAPLGLVFDEASFDGRTAQFALLDQTMIPKDQVLVTDAPLEHHAPAAHEVIDNGGGGASAVEMAFDTGGWRGQPGYRPTPKSLSRIRSGPDFGCDQLRFAFGDRPRLVEGNDFQLTGIFQINAAFDQNPRRAALASPLTTVTGVAITKAQGQAITRRTKAL
jgi:hypothetical protein